MFFLFNPEQIIKKHEDAPDAKKLIEGQHFSHRGIHHNMVRAKCINTHHLP